MPIVIHYVSFMPLMLRIRIINDMKRDDWIV